MSVLKEWVCLAHGDFESSDETPECPYGCNTVERAFRTPPGFSSSRTQGIDRTMESLAKSHKLTDMGPGAMRRKALRAEQDQARFAEFCEKRYGGLGWGNVPDGGTYNVRDKKVEGSGPGAIGAMNAAGATGSVNMEQTKPILQQMKKPVLVRQDHENLKVDLSRAPVGKVAA